MVVMASFFQIQSDYFVEFFAPKLDKHGYQAPYKRKTNEVGDEFLCIMKVGSEILHVISPSILLHSCRFCDAPKPGGPLTTRQPAEYKWRSGYPKPLQKIE